MNADKWNNISEHPLPKPLPSDFMCDFYILLYGYDKCNYTPKIILINHIDKPYIIEDNCVITHWKTVESPHYEH